ncbi:MAG TPA: exodeoxyribonuclease VII small subunit [Candidatus Hydrogenedentes bacterium]|nr:exodeoxyribonuclease VII small subunit [Candidatus Hydrogenedentota bacterium]
MTAEKKSESGFEQDLEKLEAIVEALEEGGLPLEKALKQFETGIELTRKCEQALRQAEQKIEMLVRNMDGEMAAQPFDEGEASSTDTGVKTKKKPAKRSTPVEESRDAAQASSYGDEEDCEDDDLDALF